MMIGPEPEPTVGQNGHDAIFKLLSVQALMLQIFLKVSVHPELLDETDEWMTSDRKWGYRLNIKYFICLWHLGMAE